MVENVEVSGFRRIPLVQKEKDNQFSELWNKRKLFANNQQLLRTVIVTIMVISKDTSKSSWYVLECKERYFKAHDRLSG